MKSIMVKLNGPAGITILAGLMLSLVSAITSGLLGVDCPRIMAPCSILLILPLFLGVPLPILIFIPTILFWLWSPHLFQGEANLVKRTKILGYIVAILSAAMFIKSWSLGQRYQGLQFTASYAMLSMGLAAVIITLAQRSKGIQSFKLNLVITWLIFTWIFTYAFPYLGEMP
jgi:hypothetical protein